MMLSRHLRWALLATVAATVLAALQPDQPATIARPAEASRRTAVPATEGTGETGNGPPRATANQFAEPARSLAWPSAPNADRSADWPPVEPGTLAAWQPPPPPPPPPLPPSPASTTATVAATGPPSAPAFPYALIGRIEESGQVQVLLSSPLRTLSARVNDLVDGQWRLESIQPGGVVVVWVSGGQRQTVNYRSS